MSRHTARIALDQLVGRPALVAQRYAAPAIGINESEVASGAMLADLRELAAADPAAEAAAWDERKRSLVSAYSGDGAMVMPQDKCFAFVDGKAIIPIHGALINRFAYSWSFVTGYNFIRGQLAAALADADVTAIIFDVNSYGGMVAGCQETADAIFASDKPCIAVVDSNCYSAAYLLASQCEHIAVTPSGGAGSIGVVMMHLDISKALEEFGLAVTFIFAGSHKVDGNMYEPLSADVIASFQEEVDACYDMFVAAVVRGRDLTDEDVRATEADCFRADEALSLGLIDAVANPSDAVESYFNADCDECDDADDTSDDPPEPEEQAMLPARTTQATADAAATQAAADAQARADAETREQAVVMTAAATARTAERTRISAIQGHAEAAGREALASYLALNTDLSVEAASGILAATPKAAAPPAEQQQEQNHFQDAMDRGRQPNVGAGGGEGTGDDGMTPGQKILAAQARMTGYRPPTAH